MCLKYWCIFIKNSCFTDMKEGWTYIQWKTRCNESFWAVHPVNAVIKHKVRRESSAWQLCQDATPQEPPAYARLSSQYTGVKLTICNNIIMWMAGSDYKHINILVHHVLLSFWTSLTLLAQRRQIISWCQWNMMYWTAASAAIVFNAALSEEHNSVLYLL